MSQSSLSLLILLHISIPNCSILFFIYIASIVKKGCSFSLNNVGKPVRDKRGKAPAHNVGQSTIAVHKWVSADSLNLKSEVKRHLKQMPGNKSNKLRERQIIWHREERRELMRCSKFVLRVLIKNIWIWKQERREGKGGLLLCWHHWPVFGSYYIFALEGFLGTCTPPRNKTALMRRRLVVWNIWQNNRLCWTATKGSVSWAGW